MNHLLNPLFGIYIHWPYCLSKCPYCDFASSVCKSPDLPTLLKTYARDLSVFKSKLKDLPMVTSIFFGGGTPSLMPVSFFEEILNLIQKNFSVRADVEISLEANPDAITFEKMKDFQKAGLNRLSIGIQSLNESDLHFLGRRHTLARALACIEEAERVFRNINIDLIYARPGQTVLDWETELKSALDLGLPHYSLYQLTIEENTPFGRRNIPSADEETASALYRCTDDIMKAAHVIGYEVSNYAREGYECRHNMTYWLGADYMGIGPAAQGRLNNYETGNCPRVADWIKIPPVCNRLTDMERARERVITGLRLRRQGFPCDKLDSAGIERAVSYGWGCVRNHLFYPTIEGTLLLNQLILLVTP